MNDAFFDTLKHPRSLSARQRLLLEWQQAADPRAALLELELAAYVDLDVIKGNRAFHLIKNSGAELAGPIADVVTEFIFALGLVSYIEIRASDLPMLGRCVELAPVIGVAVTNVMGDIAAFAQPALSQMVDVRISGSNIDDDAAIELSRNRYMREVRLLTLVNSRITERGLDALMSSKNFPNLITIDLAGNPCQDSSDVMENDGGYYWVAPSGAPYLETARHTAVVSSDPSRIVWPPVFQDYAWTD